MPTIRVRHPGGTWRIEVTKEETLGDLSAKVCRDHLKSGEALAIARRLSRDAPGREMLDFQKLETPLTLLGLEHGSMIHLQEEPEEEKVVAPAPPPKREEKAQPPLSSSFLQESDFSGVGMEDDPEMAAALAIAREADAEEAALNEPRRPDASVREALLGPSHTSAGGDEAEIAHRLAMGEDPLVLARMMAQRELENLRSARAARSFRSEFPARSNLPANARARRRRRRDDFDTDAPALVRDIDEASDSDDDDVSLDNVAAASPPPQERLHFDDPTPVLPLNTDDDDAALQAALLASTTHRTTSDHAVDTATSGDDDLARALAMSLDYAPAPQPQVAPQVVSNGGDQDEMDEALQSALYVLDTRCS